MEAQLIRNGAWDEAEVETVKRHRDIVVDYLGGRRETAKGEEQAEIMRCCLRMDFLVGLPWEGSALMVMCDMYQTRTGLS